MQTLNILFVLWVAVANAYPMSVSERPTNLEHKLDLEHKLVSPTTKTVTESDNLVAEDEEEPESKYLAELWGRKRFAGLSKYIRKINAGISNTFANARKKAEAEEKAKAELKKRREEDEQRRKKAKLAACDKCMYYWDVPCLYRNACDSCLNKCLMHWADNYHVKKKCNARC